MTSAQLAWTFIVSVASFGCVADSVVLGSGGNAGEGGTTTGSGGSSQSGALTETGGASSTGYGGSLLSDDSSLVAIADDAAGHSVFVFYVGPGWNPYDQQFFTPQNTAMTGATALGSDGTNLFIATNQESNALIAYTPVSFHYQDMAPNVAIARSSFPGATAPFERIVGSFPTVIASSSADGGYLFTDTGNLTSASVPKSRFTHAFQQTPSVVRDDAHDRVFAGQISGAGLLAWSNASTLTGSPAPDYSIPDVALWQLGVADNRLFGAGNLGSPPAPGVAVWDTNQLDSPVAPDFILGQAEGIDAFVERISVDTGHLVVCMQGSASHPPRVLIWNNPSILTAGTQPNAILDQTEVPKRAEIDEPNSRLFVLHASGVDVYSTGYNQPVEYMVTITGEGPRGGLTGFKDILLWH